MQWCDDETVQSDAFSEQGERPTPVDANLLDEYSVRVADVARRARFRWCIFELPNERWRPKVGLRIRARRILVDQ